MRFFLFLLVGILSTTELDAQQYINFESGDLSHWQQSPANRWGIVTGNNAIAGNYSLKHTFDNTAAGNDRLSIPLDNICFEDCEMSWRWLLKHAYDPSASNGWAVFLAADTNAIEMMKGGVVNGYAIGVNVTGSNDLLCLYKVTNGTFSVIQTTDFNWQTSVTTAHAGAVEVTRTAEGYWTVKAGVNSFDNLQMVATPIQHTQFTVARHYGLMYFYTATADRMLTMDEIRITSIRTTPFKDNDSEFTTPSSQVPPGIVSSLQTQADSAIEIFRFAVHDKATSDTLPTFLKSFIVHNAHPAGSANWIKSIAGLRLFKDSQEVPIHYTIGPDSIKITFTSDTIALNGSQEFSLSLWLQQGGMVDNSTLQFKIDRSKHSSLAHIRGSGFAAVFPADIVSSIFILAVKAEGLRLDTVSSSIGILQNFILSVQATDRYGSVDFDCSETLSLYLHTGTGVLTAATGTTRPLMDGYARWSDLRYNQAGELRLGVRSTCFPNFVTPIIRVVNDNNSQIRPPLQQFPGGIISSLSVDPAKEVPVYSFSIKDAGTGDGSPTILKELVIKSTSPTGTADWTKTLQGISLYKGSKRLVSSLTELKPTSMLITLQEGNLQVEDGDSVEITLKIHLKKKVKDGETLQFEIPATNHTCLTDSTGSALSDVFPEAITSSLFTIDVQAEKLQFSKTPPTIRPNLPFAVEVIAVDNWGATDVDVDSNCTLSLLASDVGALTSSTGLEQAATVGKFAWTDLQIDAPIAFQLRAKHPLWGEVISSEITAMDNDSYLAPPTVQAPSAILFSSDTTILQATEVLRFTIKDKGTSDGLPTRIDKMVLHEYASGSMNLSKLIGGAKLNVQGMEVETSCAITNSTIEITPQNMSVPNGSEVEVSVAVYLKPGQHTSGTTFRLYIPEQNHAWTVKAASSLFDKRFPFDLVSESFTLQVKASQLSTVGQEMLSLSGTNLPLKLAATDNQSNIDQGFNQPVAVVKNAGIGSLSGTMQAVGNGGYADFNLAYHGLGYFSLGFTVTNLPAANSLPIFSTNHIDTLVAESFSTTIGNQWEQKNDWSIENGSLRHQAGNGISSLRYPLQTGLKKGLSYWNFSIRNGAFDPSADNAFWWVLAADQANIEGADYNGYVIGVNYTGTTDMVACWKISGGTKKVLWTSQLDWNEQTEVRFAVHRMEGGHWTIYLQEGKGSMKLAGHFTDNDFQTANWTGLVYKYTTSRKGELWVNDFSFHQANTAPLVKVVKIVDKNTIHVIFDKTISSPLTNDGSSYSLTNAVGSVVPLNGINVVNDTLVRLIVPPLNDTIWKLRITGLSDQYGWPLKDTTLTLRRTFPKVDLTAKVIDRARLQLSFNLDMDSTSCWYPGNYSIKNQEGQVFSINSIQKDSIKSRSLYLSTDLLQGQNLTLHYTLATIDGFTVIDSIMLKKDYVPVRLLSVTALSSTAVQLKTDKPLLNEKAEQISNYTLLNRANEILSVRSSFLSNDGKTIILQLQQNLIGNYFTLYTQNVEDMDGFALNDTCHFRYQTVRFGDLVFNELMAKPNPAVGLPEVEYIELYNRTEDTLDLAGFRILYGVDKAAKISTGSIAPNGFAIICASSSAAQLQQYGGTITATSFPSLLDAGMQLTLVGPDTALIAMVAYQTGWYQDATKAKGGWSLEKMDADNFSDQANWKASDNSRGGTPGQPNSVKAHNKDRQAPLISTWALLDNGHLQLNFDEWLRQEALENVRHYSLSNLNISSAASNQEYYAKSVELVPSASFEVDRVYQLLLTDLQDLAGNRMADTTLYIFLASPKISTHQLLTQDSLSLTFDRAMQPASTSKPENYTLTDGEKQVVGIKALYFDQQKSRQVGIKTEAMKDTLLYLGIAGLYDVQGYRLPDTVITLRRTPPSIKATIEVLDRSQLKVSFNVDMDRTSWIRPDNYRISNREQEQFRILSVTQDSTKMRTLYLRCDSLQGSGLSLHYTLETTNGFTINDSSTLKKDFIPAHVLSITASAATHILVKLDKQLSKQKAEQTSNYIVKNKEGQLFPTRSSTLSADGKTITLLLQEALSGHDFTLSMQNLEDTDGFPLNATKPFRYQTVRWGDLVFNELMAKPNPAVGLPEVEYIELFNRSLDTIDLAGFRILYGTDKSAKIGTGNIAPKGFATISTSAAVAQLQEYGTALAATSFPSLLDAGMQLTLVAPDTTLVALVAYQASWYHDATKAKGGWSLEKMDVDNFSDQANWKASDDSRGGTPGQQNSVRASNKDEQSPRLLTWAILNNNTLQLTFDEWISANILSDTKHYTLQQEGKPIKATALEATYSTIVNLTFEHNFEIGRLYYLNIGNGLTDLAGNSYFDETISFGKMSNPEAGELVVNEILFDPYTGGSDFVEIYNRSEKTFDLRDIFLANRNKNDGQLQQIHATAQASHFIPPASYTVFTADSAGVSNFYAVDHSDRLMTMTAFPTYAKDQGTVVLLNAKQEVVDEFSYTAKMHFSILSNPQGVSLERIHYNRPTSESSNWHSAAQDAGFATPTYRNSQYAENTELVDQTFVITPKTFSPDGDAHDDLLFINYQQPTAGSMLNARIYDARGYLVKELARSLLLGTEGRLLWDGLTFDNRKAAVGVYIIYLEIYDLNGMVKKYKKTCVVAGRR